MEIGSLGDLPLPISKAPNLQATKVIQQKTLRTLRELNLIPSAAATGCPPYQRYPSTLELQLKPPTKKNYPQICTDRHKSICENL